MLREESPQISKVHDSPAAANLLALGAVAGSPGVRDSPSRAERASTTEMVLKLEPINATSDRLERRRYYSFNPICTSRLGTEQWTLKLT